MFWPFSVNGRYRKSFSFCWLSIFNYMLKTFGSEKNLVRWIKTFLKNQESCIINGGITTKYFKLERGPLPRDSISTYLFFIVLDIVFAVFKSNQKIDKLRIFEHDFFHTVYADDTNFFVKNKDKVQTCFVYLKCENVVY